ncbi:MAG TPA: hypothetical protein VET23_15095 [Chitinophagaceae bacterium]|nr:hypothetical protein [Chitinophagaceae bacterium]
MTYPAQLLPHLIFKKITADLSGYFICRKVLNKALLQEPLPPILPEELLGIETASDCFDYSINLPGIFELQHNLIEMIGEQKKYFIKYWDEVSEVTVPIYEQDFNINENIGWFFLHIERVNGITIPFNRKLDAPPNEIATAIVSHTPTNSNFWHFSIRWKDENHALISTTNSKWKNNIIATVRALLSELIIIESIQQNIEEDWYVKN